MTIVMENILRKYQDTFYPVVPFDPAKQSLASIDLTAANTELTEEIFNDTEQFSKYIDQKRKDAKAAYLIGGYNELRAVYGRSELFGKTIPASPLVEDATPVTLTIPPGDNPISNTGKVPEKLYSLETPEPRRLHLGIDVWGPAGTPIFAAMGGMIHSFAFNNHFGDYGATLILLHQLDGFPFYTLYGHLCLKDIEHVSTGQYVNRGQRIAHFGLPHENGHWPPHLHFQLILDLGLYDGDYPGVCKYSEREYYLNNCPDPDIILRMNRYLD
ncbi:MAG TPA: peptidoglycan DD-metalloendopeptidase family protein [Chitinophagaceae bacterium]|nr:peptidoglycan DD-metalloendopeptidase family protein [Chitinophagaceae bacterium]